MSLNLLALNVDRSIIIDQGLHRCFTSRGKRQLSGDLIARIMSAERAAARVRQDAETQAGRIVAEAREAASSLREEAQRGAAEQAGEILVRAQDAAAADRERMLADARRTAETFKDECSEHMDAAVAHVVQSILGRK